MKVGFGSALFLVLVRVALSHAPDTLWTRIYELGGYRAVAHSIYETIDSGYVVAGWSNSGATAGDFQILRIDDNGDSLWSRTYGGVHNELCYAVQQTSDNGFVLAGSTDTYGGAAQNQPRAWVVKTNDAGDSLWSRVYGGSNCAEFHSVQQTPDGGFLLGGRTCPSYPGGCWFWVMKLNIHGDSLWSKSFGSAAGVAGCCRSVHMTFDGGYIVAGDLAEDFFLAKLTTNGDTLWTRTFSGPHDDECFTIDATLDGGYMLGGTTQNAAGYRLAWLVKTDADGNGVWNKTFGGYNDFCNSIQQTSDGGYIMGGMTMSGPGDDMDASLIKTDANGDSLWGRMFGGDRYDDCNSVLQSRDGSYVFAGESHSYGAGTPGQDKFWVVKTEPDQILPVSLTSFSASPSSSGIRVSFSLASETINDHFEIYRGDSQDGEFSRITSLPSQGNSAAGHTYEFTDVNVTARQTYWYYLADVSVTGTRTEHRDFMRSATAIGSALALEYSLAAYPNPFNPITTISFSLAEAGHAAVNIYDISGRFIRTLADHEFTAGSHAVSFDGRDLPAGTYFVRMVSPKFSRTEKVLLLK
jgi:hypothetical protein